MAKPITRYLSITLSCGLLMLPQLAATAGYPVDSPPYCANHKITNDVTIVLTMATNSVRIGEPILIDLALKYDGKTRAFYDSQSVAVHDEFSIRGPAEKSVLYTGGSSQTMGNTKWIQPGEVVRLRARVDLTEKYLFQESGRYTIQFKGNNGAFGELTFPKSNELGFTITPGELQRVDKLVTDILPVVPKHWTIGKSRRTPPIVTPSGRHTVPGACVVLERNGMHGEIVLIWQTDKQTEEDVTKKADPKSRYLGQGNHGYIYVYLGDKADSLWPTVIDELARTLIKQPAK